MTASIETFAAAAVQLPAGPCTVTQFGSGSCHVSAAPAQGDRTGETIGSVDANGWRHDAAGARTLADALAIVLSDAPSVAGALVEEQRRRFGAEAELAKVRAQLALRQETDRRSRLFQATRAFKVPDGWCLVNKPERGLGSHGYTYASLDALQRAWAVVLGPRGVDPVHGEFVEVLRLEDELARHK